jgi:thiol-disulfide isomerase/thioredoxin
MRPLSRRTAIAGLLSAVAAPPSRAQDRPPHFETARRQYTLLRPARTAPPLRPTGLDGRAADLGALDGRVTLINFWATWCPACVNELPILERLHLAGDGVRVIAIAVDREGGPQKVSRYLQKLNVRRLPVYLDPEGVIAYADQNNERKAPFALYGMPISYVIDRAGRIAGYFPGEADWMSPPARNLLDYYRS